MSPSAAPVLSLSAMKESNARTSLLEAIRNEAILWSRDQTLISPNGRRNRWLIDLRRILTSGKVLNAFAELFWEQYSTSGPFQIGGMEVSAIPLLSAILMKSVDRGTPITGFIIRKERKTYGTGNQIEGMLSDLPIVLVDDIVNSGNSLEKARVIIESEGRDIREVFVMIDYFSSRGTAWRRSRNTEIRSVFGLSEFCLPVEPLRVPSTTSTFRNVWSFKAPDPNYFYCVPKSFPATDGRRLYFGSDGGLFWCLDAKSGDVIWSFKVCSPGHKNIWSAPALYGGNVFFGGYDGNVYCLDAASGAEIWRFTGAEWVGSSPALAPDIGLLFIGLEHSIDGRRGSVVALSMNTGELIWSHTTKRYTHASPAYSSARGLLACGSNDNEMFLFDAGTGKVLWRFETDATFAKGSIRHAPAYDENRNHLITGCANGYIYVLDLETGREVWSVKTNNTVYTVPLVVQDYAYIGSSDKHFYILDLVRRSAHKISVGSKIFGPASLIGDKIYFGACSGVVFEIDPIAGYVTGRHQLPDAVTNTVIKSSETGFFYALTYMNELFAFERLSAPE